jgi:hypothetical protein
VDGDDGQVLRNGVSPRHQKSAATMSRKAR